MPDKIQIRNSTAEFLIFTSQSGEESIEVRHAAETIWLTQKLMATLFDVTVPTINEHIKNIFTGNELEQEMEDWAKRLDMFLDLTEREFLQNSSKITAQIARDHAESEFEKYRIVQDRLFISDFDRMEE